ncbi:hypothetical protein [Sandarakinorhabdus glacialis]|nr:hypothetical protein [Polymorphobacter glacialis]
MIPALLLSNCLAMVFSGSILRHVGLGPLRILGWVFAVLQAALAIQSILTGLRADFGPEPLLSTAIPLIVRPS